MFPFLIIGSLLILVFIIVRSTFKGNLKGILISCGIYVAIAFAIALYSTIASAMVFMVLSCLVAAVEIIRALCKNKFNRFIPHIVGIILTTIYFTHAFIVAQGLVIKNYDIDLGAQLKIAHISDTHIGSYFDVDDLRKCVDLINENEPDIVVITGDLVDENTTLTEMREACEVLSTLRSTYGTYFIPGNHEDNMGMYKKVKNGYQTLVRELKNNNVNVLDDKVCEIGDDFVLIGRLDGDFEDRSSLSMIVSGSGIDTTGKKVIVLDHRPFNLRYVAEDPDVDVDLMLSGHTHGGQIFPVNVVYKLISKKDDIIYGMAKIGDTYFIVNAGTSSGEVPLKNMVKNEIVFINIR